MFVKYYMQKIILKHVFILTLSKIILEWNDNLAHSALLFYFEHIKYQILVLGFRIWQSLFLTLIQLKIFTNMRPKGSRMSNFKLLRPDAVLHSFVVQE